jgi:predicted nucleic acid-binding Zn ribbon protein
MDCPNCGVFNPEDRVVCWRCDQPLPKPKEAKKARDPALFQRRIWLIVAVALAIWLLLTWLLPLFFGPGSTP